MRIIGVTKVIPRKNVNLSVSSMITPTGNRVISMTEARMNTRNDRNNVSVRVRHLRTVTVRVSLGLKEANHRLNGRPRQNKQLINRPRGFMNVTRGFVSTRLITATVLGLRLRHSNKTGSKRQKNVGNSRRHLLGPLGYTIRLKRGARRQQFYPTPVNPKNRNNGGCTPIKK